MKGSGLKNARNEMDQRRLKTAQGHSSVRGDSLDSQFAAEFTVSLLGFNREAVPYCQGLSDPVAHEYAMEYARMLQNRAKGLDRSLPRIPYGLFEPDRNLIRATLERMCEKYFPSKMQRH